MVDDNSINTYVYLIFKYFRYDPYEKKLTEEFYEHEHMRQLRFKAINRTQNAKKIGIILGTLGRQGSIAVLDYLMVIILHILVPNFCIFLR